MGSGIAGRLLDAGHSLTGWNRTPGKAEGLVARGMRTAAGPRQVAEAAEVTFSMVRDTAALEAVTEGPGGILAGLGPGKLYVDLSTVSPAASRALAERVRARGAEMLDAPVSGSVVTLREGALSVMVGGSAEAFARARPVLEAVGPRVTHVGGNGQAVLMKLATNLGLAVQMLAFSESVLLAEKGGIPRELAVEVLTGSVIASPMVRYRAGYVLDRIEEVMFDCSMMQKDLDLALAEAGRHSVPLPTTAVAREYLSAARGMGLGERDFAAVFAVLARMAGVEP